MAPFKKKEIYIVLLHVSLTYRERFVGRYIAWIKEHRRRGIDARIKKWIPIVEKRELHGCSNNQHENKSRGNNGDNFDHCLVHKQWPLL